MNSDVPDAFRTARLKIIPRVFAGPWFVKKTGNSCLRCCLIIQLAQLLQL